MGRLIPAGRARVVSPLVRDARLEAAAIRARARADAARIEDLARRDGIASGEARVIDQVLALTAQAAELREGASREIGTLALEVAARIVQETVAADPALLERIVFRALSRARDESRVDLFLHPDDRAALTERLASSGGLPDTIRLVDAPAQARGGCVVSSDRIRIDARVESALEAIARAMGVDIPGR